MTLRELSNLANVSVSTVSKALNGGEDVSEETRELVLNLANQNGYNRVKHRRPRKSGFAGPVIAVIYSDIKSHFYSQLLHIIDLRLRAAGGLMISANCQFDLPEAVKICNYLIDTAMVDGIIGITANPIQATTPNPHIPIVGISYRPRAGNLPPQGSSYPYDYIYLDTEVSMYETISYFVRNGHRKIGYIGDPFSIKRLDYFKTAMEQCHCKVDENLIVVSNHRFEEAGYDAMTTLLDRGTVPTAIFAAYDDIALGASKVLTAAGYCIPRDISISSIDNTLCTLDGKKLLGSIDCHLEELADMSIALILKKLENPEYNVVQNISVRTEFLPRDTVGPAPTEK